jgi:MFS family permease
MTFALLSISTIFSQYIFTDAFPLSNNKLLIYGILLLSFSYTVMALYPKISVYYLAIIVNGLGGGLLRPAISSSLSLAQSPEHQGSVAGYLGSVYPIGHILTPVLAMPIYAYNPAYLYYFSSILCLICFIFIITNPVFKEK